MNKLITIQTASERLGVSKWYIRRLPESKLKTYRTDGGHRRYRESDIESLIIDMGI